MFEPILLHIIVSAFNVGHDVLPVGLTPKELVWRRACLDLMREHDTDMPDGIYEVLFSELELRRPWPDPPDSDDPVSLQLVA